MKEQLLLSWQINNDKNFLLLQFTSEAMLKARVSAKGRTVAEQMAHLHQVRLTWIDAVAKPAIDKSLSLAKGSELTGAVLSGALTASAQKIADVIESSWAKEGKLPGFKAGLIPFVSYLISHESHHRGNILLTLKQCGFQLPNELKWGLWEWANALPARPL